MNFLFEMMFIFPCSQLLWSINAYGGVCLVWMEVGTFNFYMKAYQIYNIHFYNIPFWVIIPILKFGVFYNFSSINNNNLCKSMQKYYNFSGSLIC
jgi:hypothetical protein